jgi:multiple sugar transport system permease protein/raffinose/stachyose/melibiose transport system permease protein
MTNGGPSNSTTTIVHQIYTRAFGEFFVGYGAAIACVALVIVLTITLINFKYGSKQTDIGMG